MKRIFLLKINLCCLFLQSYSLYVEDNRILKNGVPNLDKPITQANSTFISDLRKCLFKEANAKIKQILLENSKKLDYTDNSNVMYNPLRNSKIFKRQIRQNPGGTENPDINWDNCVLKSDMEEHKLMEHEHMLAIKDEVEKLRQLIRLLQDQQYILNIMHDFEDKPKSKNMDDEEHIRQLLFLLKNNSQKEKGLDEPDNSLHSQTMPVSKETSKLKQANNISSIIKEVEKLKGVISNLQNDREEENLKQEILNQKKELIRLREFIRRSQKPQTTTKPAIANLTTANPKMRHTEEIDQMETIQEELRNLQSKLSFFMSKSSNNSNSTDEINSIVGATLSRLQPLQINNTRNRELTLRKAASENEDDDMKDLLHLLAEDKTKSKISSNTETNKLQKQSRNFINKSNKQLISNTKVRAESDDLLDDVQRLLDNSGSNADFDLDLHDDMESKLSGLQRQLEISSKIKKLEKKINQLHTTESKSLDDQDDDENIKKKIKKIEKQLKKLNNAEGKNLNDDDDIIDQLKTLQSDINRLRPKDDDEDFETSEGKQASIQLALNKLLFGGKKPSVGHRPHLSPSQVQLLKKKITAMKQGGSYDQNNYGNLLHGGSLSPYGSGSGISYGSSGANIYGGGANYKPGYGSHDASFAKYEYGKHGSNGGLYGSSNNNNNYLSALHTLLSSQYGSGGSYESGGYGSKFSGAQTELYGLGPSSYASNAHLYGSNKNQYEVNLPYPYGTQSYPLSYGQGPPQYGSLSNSYQLKDLYNALHNLNHGYNSASQPYGSYGNQYGSGYNSASQPYGSYGNQYGSGYNSGSQPYGSYGNQYGSGSILYGPLNIPYGLGANLYGSSNGQHESASSINNIGSHLYGSSYSNTNEKYGSNPYALPSTNTNPYLSGNVYSNKYGPGSDSYPYVSPKFEETGNNQYSTSSHFKTQPYGPVNDQPAFSDQSYSEQYANEGNNYGTGNKQQYRPTGEGNQYGSSSANLPYLNGLSQNSNSGYSSQPYANSKVYSQPESVSGLQSNTYTDGDTATNVHKPQPYINVHNMFEHLSHGYKDSKPQFFPAHDKGYQANSENYQSATNTNTQNSDQSYAYAQQDVVSNNAYAQEKVNELKTQIYTLQNVINNLNRPEYTPKAEDKEMVYHLNKKISDLKNVVSHLSQDVPYSNSPSKSPTKTGYRQSNLGLGDDKDDFQKDEDFVPTQRKKREVRNTEAKSQIAVPEILRQLKDVTNVIKYFKKNLLNEEVSISSGREDKKPIIKRETLDSDNSETKKSQSKNSDAMSNFLHQLGDIMEVISYFSQNLPQANNDSLEHSHLNQNYTVQFNKDNKKNDTIRQTRKVMIVEKQEDFQDSFSALLKRLTDLIDKVNNLAQNVSTNNCACTNCSANKNLRKDHIRKKRQLDEEQDDEEEEEGAKDDSENGAKLFVNKLSSFFKEAFDEAPSQEENNVIIKETTRQKQHPILNQEQWKNNHQTLQQRLEELKKQLDSKLHTSTHHQQLPTYRQNTRPSLYNTNKFASSYTNPFSRYAYYSQPSYYPVYYQQPQYYYPQPSYEFKDKKEKIKTKKKLKKSDKLDKIFSKILDKIIDKVEEAIPKITRKIFGLGVEKIFSYDYDDYGYGKGDYGYGQGGYGYDQNSYALQKTFKNMGLFGYIPLIILKLLTGLSSFVKTLQKNRFIKTFLVPALVTAGTAGLVVFLVWWLTGDDQHHYGGYGKGYGYSENYDNGYRSNTGNNMEGVSYYQNNYDTSNSYGRQNGLVRSSEIKNNQFRSANTNDNYNYRSSNNNIYYRQHNHNNNNNEQQF